MHGSPRKLVHASHFSWRKKNGFFFTVTKMSLCQINIEVTVLSHSPKFIMLNTLQICITFLWFQKREESLAQIRVAFFCGAHCLLYSHCPKHLHTSSSNKKLLFHINPPDQSFLDNWRWTTPRLQIGTFQQIRKNRWLSCIKVPAGGEENSVQDCCKFKVGVLLLNILFFSILNLIWLTWSVYSKTFYFF
jgi:hypothetical protein